MTRARKRHGVFTWDDALAAGLSADDARRMISSGWWRLLHPSVYAAASTPETKAVKEAAALAYLGTSAVLSHFSAAAHLRLEAPDFSGRVWATVPHGVVPAPRPGIRVMRSRRMVDISRVIDGMVVTHAARTVVDLSRHLEQQALGRVLSEAVRREKVSLERVLAAAEGMGGRAGLRDLRKVCQEFDPLFESWLEEQALPLLVEAAGVELEQQVEMKDADGRFFARVDFYLRSLRLAIEVDGWSHHSSVAAANRDARRDRQLASMGILVLRFTTDDVLRRPREVVREVAQHVLRLTNAA